MQNTVGSYHTPVYITSSTVDSSHYPRVQTFHMNIDVPDCVGALTQHKQLPNILAVPWKTTDHLALTIGLGLGLL